MNGLLTWGGLIFSIIGFISVYMVYSSYDATKEGAKLTLLINFLFKSLPFFLIGSYLSRRGNAIAREEERLARLEYESRIKETFPDHWEYILSNQIVLGMTFDMITIIYGEAYGKKISVNKDHTVEKYKYKPYTNKHKKISYQKEVTFKNGIVTAWKDL